MAIPCRLRFYSAPTRARARVCLRLRLRPRRPALRAQARQLSAATRPPDMPAKKSVRWLSSTVPAIVPALQKKPPQIHNGRQCIVRAPSAQRLVSRP